MRIGGLVWCGGGGGGLVWWLWLWCVLGFNGER